MRIGRSQVHRQPVTELINTVPGCHVYGTLVKVLLRSQAGTFQRRAHPRHSIIFRSVVKEYHVWPTSRSRGGRTFPSDHLRSPSYSSASLSAAECGSLHTCL